MPASGLRKYSTTGWTKMSMSSWAGLCPNLNIGRAPISCSLSVLLELPNGKFSEPILYTKHIIFDNMNVVAITLRNASNYLDSAGIVCTCQTLQKTWLSFESHCNDSQILYSNQWLIPKHIAGQLIHHFGSQCQILTPRRERIHQPQQFPFE